MIFMLAIAGGLAALLVHPPAGFPLGPIPAAQGVLLFSMFLLLFLPMTEMRPSAKNGPRQVFGQLQFQIVFFVFLFTAQIPQPEESLLGFLQRLWGFILLGPWIVLVWMGFHLLPAAYRLRHRRLINWRKALSRIALLLAGLAAFALLLGHTGWTSPAMALWASIIALGWLASLPWVQQQWKQFETRRTSTPALPIIANLTSVGVVVSLTTILHRSPEADLMPVLIGAMIGLGSTMLILRFRQDQA